MSKLSRDLYSLDEMAAPTLNILSPNVDSFVTISPPSFMVAKTWCGKPLKHFLMERVLDNGTVERPAVPTERSEGSSRSLDDTGSVLVDHRTDRNAGVLNWKLFTSAITCRLSHGPPSWIFSSFQSPTLGAYWRCLQVQWQTFFISFACS